jgi:hypothetical protein
VDRLGATARPATLGGLLAHIFSEAKSLVTDYAELAVLDARRAAVNLAWLLASVLIVAVLLITAWMGLVAALIIWLSSELMPWGWAIVIAAGLNIVAAAALGLWAKSLLKDLPFTALLRQLRGEDPPPAPLNTGGPK